MHDIEKALAEAAANPPYRITATGPVTITPPSVVRELAAALDHWRWCWDCGARDQDCRALGSGRKCCPDCRHRDTGAPYLNPLFAPYFR